MLPHLIDQIRMGLPKEQRADKKERLQCGCNLAWMKKDGLMLWNAVAICEMFKISWQMGEHLVRDDLENHLKDRSFRLVQQLNIFRFLLKTSQGSTNLVRKSYQECSSDSPWLQGESGKEIFCLHALWSREIVHVRNPRSKAQCNGNCKVFESCWRLVVAFEILDHPRPPVFAALVYRGY